MAIDKKLIDQLLTDYKKPVLPDDILASISDMRSMIRPVTTAATHGTAKAGKA